MWKFKASKFKNAAPKIPQKDEWISEVSTANIMHSYSNNIEASAYYMAFSTDCGGGGNLGILPLSVHGRQEPNSIPLLRAHAGTVLDFKFSPFDDFCLATSAEDGMVKIWKLPNQAENKLLSAINPFATLSVATKAVQTLTWHPSVSDLIMATADKRLSVVNVKTEQEVIGIDCHGDQIQSCSWCADGSVIVTSCKDKQLRIIDPRAKDTVTECSGHKNMKDSRVVWLGDKNLILSTGFNLLHSREICLRDSRNITSPLSTKTFDASSGVMIPLYDADTGMLFIGGKSDTLVRYLEVTDVDLLENRTDNIEQIKGLCLVPKRALDVMACEVNRLLVLSQHAVLPLPYYVARRFRDQFYEELFPPTNSTLPGLTIDEWLDNKNGNVSTIIHLVEKISLDPHAKQNLIGTSLQQEQPSKKVFNEQPANTQMDNPSSDTLSRTAPVETADHDKPLSEKPSVVMRQKKTYFSGVRQSKFRHLEGVPLHKSHNIENIRNLSKALPGESDMFHANTKFCALPLGGSGGLVAVLKINEPGRLPDTGLPVLQNSSLVADFVWDPFDDHTLAVACEDASIKVWKIPEERLVETLTEPYMRLSGHTEKIYFVRYHPLASGVLASGSYDGSVRIWDLSTGTERIQLTGHTDTIFCLSWSPDGTKCATACKDGFIRIYDPRKSTQPIQTGSVPANTRGARIVWACDGKLLLIVGFEKSSDRSIRIFSPDDLTKLLHKEDLDVSPTILVPYYDEDSSTLFLTGRGESVVKTFEIALEEPYLFPLSHYKCDNLHQALAFLPKTVCDVSKVQFARALRLTTTNIEPIAFVVPRIKTQYFQDDLFPDTKVTWEPTVSSSEWFAGIDRPPKRITLRPENMPLLSDVPVPAPKPKKYESYNPVTYKTDEQKKEELFNALLGKLDVSDAPLPQDLTEGVDEDEWDD